MWIFTANFQIGGNAVTSIYRLRDEDVEVALRKLFSALRERHFPKMSYDEFRSNFMGDGTASFPTGIEIRCVHPNDEHYI